MAMATKKTTKGQPKKVADAKPAGKNGKKADGRSGSSFFTWFVVLALLGVWTSVAVVWFELVDYDDVLARAKEFRYNISEVLQGKLGAYDADGDGDFDVEDAKILLGLQDKPAFESKREPVQGDLPVPPVEEPEPEVVEEEEEVIPSYSQDAYAAPEAEAEAEPRVVTEDEEELVLVEEAEVEEPVGGEEESPAVDDDEEQVEVEESPDPEETEHEEEEEMEPAVEDSEPEETLYLDEEEGEFSQGDEEDIQDAAAVSEDSEDAAVPLPELQEDTGEVDSAAGEAHPYDDNLENVIDTQGEAVEDNEADDEPEETVDELTQEEVQEDQTDRSEDVVDTQGKVLQDTEAEETIAEEPSDGEELSVTEESGAAEELVQAESSPQEEPAGTAEPQQEDKPKEKAKKKKPKLLNKFDKTIKAEIDAAEKLRKKGKLEDAMKAFENLVQKYPQSPRCRYGKAQSEDDVAEKMRSNEILQKAINTYREAAELPDVPADLLRATLKRRAERQQFLGRMRGALATLERLVQIFPEDVSLKNDLGVGYLLLGDNKSAKKIYEEVLSAAPGDGFAKVHYGFILKSENKIVESIPFLQEGLESGDPGTDDGRFFFHLGDALQRMGDSSAYKWYELGHQRGHFASVWQRSLYNVKGLKAQAWWTARETGYTDLVRTLERNWKTIRDEALAVMDTSRGLFLPEDENLREKGEWGQFTLWQQGRKVEKSCQSVPKTCGLLDRYPEATGCKRGQIKYSVMQPGTHVWPHTGPTNCRLRMHLGLVIPATGCRIRCTNDTRAWEEGKVLIFDDSFEHEVWQDAGSYRLIFIVDVWHPELTQYQRQTLTPI